MMRSLWTAASGMTSQQLNVDTIANNLANVNTTAYKKERMEFKSLLYETMQRADLDPANPASRPVNLQVGHGVRPIAVSRMFTMGNIQLTENSLDFALEGPGFFTIMMPGEETGYTKDGSFKLSVEDGGEFTLVTSSGYRVLDADGEPITIPATIKSSDVIVSDTGQIGYLTPDGGIVDLGIMFNIVQFPNEQGLEAVGNNLFIVTPASGAPLMESEGELSRYTTVIQGSLEMANVQVAQEMVDLIVAQRAYELNSKVIQSSDDMLAQANNLKRV